MKSQKGITLVELLVVMSLLAVLILLSSQTFPIIFKQSRKEIQVVQAQIEGIIGLEILRNDIEHAGFGLPQSFRTAISYSEAASSPASNYNDSPSNPPRPLLSGNNAGYNGSDYLIVKSTIIADNLASRAWGYVTKNGKKSFQPEILKDDYRVIVIKPKVDEKRQMELVTYEGAFFSTYGALSSFSPSSAEETYLIYGIDSDTDPRMPFNRADFYIKRPSDMPSYCAAGTGILYKGIISQANGSLRELPLLECVADMQVLFGLDQNADGGVDTYTEDLSGLSASQIRQLIKEVRIYILTHEGPKDTGYFHGTQVMKVGEGSYGRDFDLQERFGSDWKNYRWKILSIAIKPRNL